MAFQKENKRIEGESKMSDQLKFIVSELGKEPHSKVYKSISNTKIMSIITISNTNTITITNLNLSQFKGVVSRPPRQQLSRSPAFNRDLSRCST